MSGLTGTEFKAIREELGLSQEELAKILCLSGKQAVSNIETGFRNPSRLTSALMQAFVELPKQRSKELREMLYAISLRQSGKRTKSK